MSNKKLQIVNADDTELTRLLNQYIESEYVYREFQRRHEDVCKELRHGKRTCTDSELLSLNNQERCYMDAILDASSNRDACARMIANYLLANSNRAGEFVKKQEINWQPYSGGNN